jgi:hypothetical protein
MTDKKTYPGWTPKQREWILRRDNFKCQFVKLEYGVPQQCGRTEDLQVHHIIPKNWAWELLKLPEEKVNCPENGIVLCKKCHLGFIHFDFGVEARFMYKYRENSYKTISERHQAMTKVGVPYWWTQWDDTLKIIARIRTWLYLRENPDDPFPFRKRR